MTAYFWIKSFHVVFVMAWMATVFYLPRILVNIAEVGDEPAVRARLILMSRRLYTFGHNVFGVAVVFGLVLWQGWRLWPQALPNMTLGLHWLDAKLTLVFGLLVYFTWMGRMVKRADQGGPLPSSKTLRVLNELPVLVLLGVVYLVIAKPF
ncbi:MAG: CopD family protein [Deltaproteobacteria bacterium]|nr:CopD family protein [Deltaproteobacteria bacterium]